MSLFVLFLLLSNVQADLWLSTHCPFANLAPWPKKFVHPCVTGITYTSEKIIIIPPTNYNNN